MRESVGLRAKTYSYRLSLHILLQVKQTQTIEEQGKKQLKAIEDNKIQLVNKKRDDNEFLFSKEMEIFKNIYSKRFNKIDKLSKETDYGN